MAVPQTALLILNRARDNRDTAERARRLARGFADDSVIDNLTRYANELEQQALDLERRARTIAETISETAALSADIHGLVAEVRTRLRALRPGS